MKNKIIQMSLGIILLLSLNLVSAAYIDVSPASISLHGYSGETISKDIVITTDGIYAVQLNISTNLISFAPSDYFIVNHIKNITMNFTIPPTLDAQNISFDLTASFEAPDAVVINQVNNHYDGGGLAYVLPNGTIVYKKPENMSNQTQIINVTEDPRIKELQEEIQNLKENQSKNPAKSNISELIWILPIIALALIIFWLVKSFRLLSKLKGKNKEVKNERYNNKDKNR